MWDDYLKRGSSILFNKEKFLSKRFKEENFQGEIEFLLKYKNDRSYS